MKRFLAVLAAVWMIGLSLFIRARLDDGGSSSTGSKDGRLTIACITELRAACESYARANGDIQIVVEDAATTLDKVGDYDGWLTLAPWPDIAGIRNGSQPLPATVLGHADLQVAVVREREQALTAACGGTVTWKCLGDLQGRQWSELGGDPQWGRLKIGLPRPAKASGLLVYATAVASWFGRTDFGTNDFDAEFTAWQSNLKSAFADDPVPTFVQQLPAAYTAVGSTSVDIQRNLGTRADRVSVLTPPPATTVLLVLAPLRSQTQQRVQGIARSRDLARAITDAGWDGPTTAASNLPSAGVMSALLSL